MEETYQQIIENLTTEEIVAMIDRSGDIEIARCIRCNSLMLYSNHKGCFPVPCCDACLPYVDGCAIPVPITPAEECQCG